MRVYSPSDLGGRRLRSPVAVIGFGNQGHAHALNLRDRGVPVMVGARKGGAGWNAATLAGFDVHEIADAVGAAAVAAVLLPDEVQRDVFARAIAPALAPGAALVFAHGFTVAFGEIAAPAGHDVVLVAPKGQGHYLRRAFIAGGGVPCLLAVGSDATGQALGTALAYADAIGCLSAGAIETTFREEAITDLFGEQAVLCGGVPELVKAAFDTLVENGYSPEVAYIECLHELKIITDLMVEGGLDHMRERISATAAWGSYQAGPRVVDARARAALETLLEDIASGRFARTWLEEASRGGERLKAQRREEAAHAIERAGREVRALIRRPQTETRKEPL